jgi:hypothetical protein
MDFKFRSYVLGLQSSISHNIAQNLNADTNFDIESYLAECKQLFVTIGMDESVISDIIDVARHEGQMEYAMGVVQSHGSAQLKPEYAYEHAITLYKQLTGGIKS